LSGIQAVDGLLHKRPTLTNATIDLFGQDFEALVAENDRLALSRFGNNKVGVAAQENRWLDNDNAR
jgi:hypothetical protein